MGIFRLNKCLQNNISGYIMPFLWYSGEEWKTVEREIEAINACGIDEFIFENRGGDWFCTEKWFELFSRVLDMAAAKGMKIWLLDDSHVNTGSANDTMNKAENAHLRPQNLRIVPVDIVGPLSAGALLIPRHTGNEQVVSISAFRRDDDSGICKGEPICLTEKIIDGLCQADFPEGLWRVFFIMTTDPEKQGIFANYITMVSKESCRHLIDEVHEKIYARFSQYFGNTFAGFFSDEPAFGNCDGNYGYDFCNHRMGELQRFYPWHSDVEIKLAEKSGMTQKELMLYLPALWDDVTGISAELRVAYMDVITELWQENFSVQIGKWCEEHNCCYIGHCLEDNGAHMHTGWGCGHFFRAMKGQHMAGTDVVLNQMLPGVTLLPHSANCGSKISNSKFYQYTLQKLGASLAHITPHMANNAVCEIMGGYGWSAGLPVIKSILNHCLACGINHFIPHAMSMQLPEVFNNSETSVNRQSSTLPPGYCPSYMPPTFYTGGFNPQYKLWGALMKYAQRVSHLLSGGVHVPDVALFYNAESDWSGSEFRNMDDITSTLTRSGVDFDIIPSDQLYCDSYVSNGELIINKENYSALIVPYSKIVPKQLLEKFEELSAAGVPVIFSDDLPENGFGKFIAVEVEKIPSIVKKRMHFAKHSVELRRYTLKNGDGSLFHFFNNEGLRVIDTHFYCEIKDNYVIYDPWINKLYKPEVDSNWVRLRLLPQQLLVFISGIFDNELPHFQYDVPKMEELKLSFNIFLRNAGEKDFRLLCSNSPAENFTWSKKLTRTCGEFRYEGDFYCSDSAKTVLIIPEAGDCAELWVNDDYCGSSIGPVCRFDIAGKIRSGKNHITIFTADTPAYADRDPNTPGGIFSGYLPLVKHGFTGSVFIG